MQLDDLKNFVSTTENKLEYFLKKHKNNLLFLYGGGLGAIWYLNLFKREDISLDGIIESNPKTESLYGQKIYNLQQAMKIGNKFDVVIGAPKYSEEIRQILLEHGIIDENIFDFEAEIYCSFIKDIEGYRKYLLTNWERIEKLFSSLQDTKSVETLEAFIRGRISADLSYFKKIYVPNQYYPNDIFNFTNSETLVELGSNNGLTLLEFIDKVNGKYKKIFCFEPEYESVLKDIISRQSGNITLIEKAAWDKQEDVTFVNDNGAATAHVDREACTLSTSYIVHADSVDNCIGDEHITYIKMDIEGAEVRALKGCEKTILRDKPKLAVCIYHEPSDFLEISEYLHSLVPEYKFYVRHHNISAEETVLYAKI